MQNTKSNAGMDERELIKKAIGGDEASFEALVSSCKGRSYNIALRYMGNEEDALDALQESLIKIFRHLDKFHGQSRFDTWAYRIVVNTCNDMLRKNKKSNVADAVYRNEDHEKVAIEVADSKPGPAEQLEIREERAYILWCLDRVGADHREILILRDIQGFTYDEISQIFRCSIGTVKSRISRARHKLKDIYLRGREQNNR